MRLTLRTLLSYLDDTLPASEARAMGEKVAESDVAPELIERIAKVTRRRGLSSQAVIGEADERIDANVVAEYLDNTLPEDEIAQLEQKALDSDAHLAEIASCHQILTLVLGEPAKVPQTARQRMYRVVKGKEALPYRKSTGNAAVAGIDGPASVDDTREYDEPLLMGLSGNQIAYSLAGAIGALLALIVVIYFAIPTARPAANQGYVALVPGPIDPKLKVPNGQPVKKIEPITKKPVEDPKKIDETPIKKEPVEPVKEKEPVVAKDETELLPLPREFDPRPIIPIDKPDMERKAMAKLESRESLLVVRRAGNAEWDRAVPLKDLYSTDTLMSLPGNRNDVRLDNGIRLQLWGTMPEFIQIDQLDILESRLVLHVPPAGLDADITLESGRLFISRPAAKDMPFEPARIRVRFRDEVWEVTLLTPDTEICFDLFGYYGEGVPFTAMANGPPPTMEVYFAVLAGKVGLKLKSREYATLTAPTRLTWDSAGLERAEPTKIPDNLLEWWSKTNKDGDFQKLLQAAVVHYASRFSKMDGTRIDVAFFSAMQDQKEQPGRRIYAVRSLQALDAIRYLADALVDDVRPVRQSAIRGIQHWTGLAPERDLQLYRMLIDEKQYTEAQARNILDLLHPFAREDYAKPDIIGALFDAMKHDKIAIRELATRHMEYCDPAGAKEVGGFDPGAPPAARDAALMRWKASWKRRNVDGK